MDENARLLREFREEMGVESPALSYLDLPSTTAAEDWKREFVASNLSPAHREALAVWQNYAEAPWNKAFRTDYSRDEINEALRFGKDPHPMAWQAMIGLDEAMQQSVVTQDVVVARGFSLPNAAHALQPGSVFEDKGYVATSLFKDTAEGFAKLAAEDSREDAVFAEIYVPAGSRALDVEGGFAESELLLPRGSRFHVEQVQRDEKGMLRARLSLLPGGSEPQEEAIARGKAAWGEFGAPLESPRSQEDQDRERWEQWLAEHPEHGTAPTETAGTVAEVGSYQTWLSEMKKLLATDQLGSKEYWQALAEPEVFASWHAYQQKQKPSAPPGDFAGTFAHGGEIPTGEWGIAGEAGPELITSLDDDVAESSGFGDPLWSDAAVAMLEEILAKLLARQQHKQQPNHKSKSVIDGPLQRQEAIHG